MKQAAVRLLRQAHLLSTAEVARYALSSLKSAYDNRAFRRDNPGIALPPKPLMYDALSHVQYRSYIRSGGEAARTIASVAAAYLGDRPVTVCEWGVRTREDRSSSSRTAAAREQGFRNRLQFAIGRVVFSEPHYRGISHQQPCTAPSARDRANRLPLCDLDLHSLIGEDAR